jgi:hypothetical protein
VPQLNAVVSFDQLSPVWDLEKRTCEMTRRSSIAIADFSFGTADSL